ncbi:MAG: type II toxin-antitoxin system Phd/YefM family antitoxin [Alphaproteobacteria bacterium]
MNIVTVSQARSNLYRLIDDTNTNHQPTFIKGKRNNAILVCEEDWRSIQETIYLFSITGMAESIIEGKKVSIEDCSEEIEFWPGK